MNCARFAPLLAASPDELDAVAASAVAGHVATCDRCRAESARFARVRSALAYVSQNDPQPGPDLVPAILAATTRHRSRRVIPLVPIPPVEVARAIQDNREVIVGVGAAAVVAAGAAWVLYKGLRSIAKPSVQRA